MKILHVITGLQKAAGTTTFVENVVREQRALGHTVDVCTNDNQNEKLHHSSLITHHSSLDLIHIHGLWSPLLHRAARFARNRQIPVVWSTHGMTAPWSLRHKWWKKALPWYLYQKSDLKRAALIHCTTDLEVDWNHALGFPNTFIAPLGTTLPVVGSSVPLDRGRTHGPSCAAIGDTTNDALGRDCGPLGDRPLPRTLLYVGRIYPVKALDNAIRAVALMKEDVVLRIVGPDQAGHLAELVALCDELHLPYAAAKNSTRSTCSTRLIQFAGPRYDAELSAEYDDCDGLILVSHTENFGATVVDAMAHGKPVITSIKTPWKIVADKNCGWWVDNSPESLANTFDGFALTSTSDLNLLGQNGLALVKQSYTWPAIARNLVEHYQQLTTNH